MEKQTNYSPLQTKEPRHPEAGLSLMTNDTIVCWIIHAISVHEKEMQLLEKS